MDRRVLTGIVLAAALFSGPSVWAATYKIDKDHTTVGFKIRHLFSRVQGRFDQFEGTIEFEPDKPSTWQVQATIQAASINTGVSKRDNHLRSKDFFDVERYPAITFKSTAVNGGNLEGILSMHGVEKPVVLNLEVHGVGKDPWGNVRAGFTATTKINRKDFGLTWNEVIEGGQVLVGEEVEITLEVEGIEQQASQSAASKS